jgi:hypothetical protein
MPPMRAILGSAPLVMTPLLISACVLGRPQLLTRLPVPPWAGLSRRPPSPLRRSRLRVRDVPLSTGNFIVQHFCRAGRPHAGNLG